MSSEKYYTRENNTQRYVNRTQLPNSLYPSFSCFKFKFHSYQHLHYHCFKLTVYKYTYQTYTTHKFTTTLIYFNQFNIELNREDQLTPPLLYFYS